MVPSKVDKCEDSQDNKRMQREGKPGRITACTACTACHCLPLDKGHERDRETYVDTTFCVGDTRLLTPKRITQKGAHYTHTRCI